MEVSTPDDDAARRANDGSIAAAAGQTGLRMTAADEFLAAATKEYQEGHIDAALWARAAAQSGADESLAIAAYLRARATALRLQRRDRRAERRASRAGSMQGTRRDTRSTPRRTRKMRRPRPRPRASASAVRNLSLKYAAMAAVALASVVAVVRLMAPPQESDSAGQPSVSVAAPSAERSSPARPVASAQPVAGSTSGGTSHDDAASLARGHGAATEGRRQLECPRALRIRVDAKTAGQCDRMERAQHRICQSASIR